LDGHVHAQKGNHIKAIAAAAASFRALEDVHLNMVGALSDQMVALNDYLSHGGSVRYAIDVLLTTTMKVLLKEDWEHEEFRLYWEYEEFRYDVEAHPLPMPWDTAFPIAWAKCMELAPEDPLISMGPYDHSDYH
jgi:hypothetical protein